MGLSCCTSKKKNKEEKEQFDHYMDVKDKYPPELISYFKLAIPSLKAKKMSGTYNRILDESVLTQLSNKNLKKPQGVPYGD